MFKINDYDLLTDYVMTNQVVTPPEAQTLYIDVPGRDGPLDLTESLYGLKFRDRKIRASFVSKKFEVQKFNMLLRRFQGKKIKLFLESDYYFSGRLSFSSFDRLGTVGKFEINMQCDPYRYKKDITTVQRSVNGTELIILENESMASIPLIETTSEVQVKYESNSFVVNKGKHLLPIVLIEGSNEIEIVGTSTVTFTYQEGAI